MESSYSLLKEVAATSGVPKNTTRFFVLSVAETDEKSRHVPLLRD
jgi:hypothetical protein